MLEKEFHNLKIVIRQPNTKDLQQPEKFQRYINALVAENAMILVCTKKSKNDEIAWLKSVLSEIKKRKGVYLIAEYNNKIAGLANITLGIERHGHIGTLGISIAKQYRGIGLGKYLTAEIIKLAKKNLKPKPKIIRLSVYQGNMPAMKLYEKMGFKRVAAIPKQTQYNAKLIDEIVMLLEV